MGSGILIPGFVIPFSLFLFEQKICLVGHVFLSIFRKIPLATGITHANHVVHIDA